ncbi:restriction endonuclease subunit S [Streptomyces sp. TLI_171]|uniref:restriction endonuclease subunit S n=1 Tax=Streptomyces sp. TLI_171 TaxID=1938859 RepID=UPI000C1A41C1|nr:restriction endonuclease subunit S [Streptomyces sp. TLI_171]
MRVLDRPARSGLGVITAYRDGAVTLRSNRREDGYTFSDTENGYQEIRPGDLVFHALDGFAGAVGVSDSHGNGSPVYHVCEPIAGDDPSYLARLLRHLGTSGFLTTQAPNVRERSVDFRNWSTFARIPLMLPPADEQRVFADYLDRETARIEIFIEEQRRLIELLRERRAAAISHAVLDATTVRTQLRRVVDVIDCAHVTAEFVDDDKRYPVASIRECRGTTVDLSECNYTTAEFFDHLRASGRAPHSGDLLFIRNVSVGLVSVVTPDLPEFAVGQETVLLRRRTDIDPSFLRYALIGTEVRHAIEGAMIGSTFRRINVSAVRALPVPLPSLHEQRRIAVHLDEHTAKTDKLIAETERFIELAQERCAALIASAVTGQMDVREAVA